MAKKAGAGKKTARTRKRASLKAVRLRKPTVKECLELGIFRGHSAAAIFREGDCDRAAKRKWAAYLKKLKK